MSLYASSDSLLRIRNILMDHGNASGIVELNGEENDQEVWKDMIC